MTTLTIEDFGRFRPVDTSPHPQHCAWCGKFERGVRKTPDRGGQLLCNDCWAKSQRSPSGPGGVAS